MPLTNPALVPGPVGPLKDKRIVAGLPGDHDEVTPLVWPGGAIVQAGSAGNIVYRTLEGSATITETVAIGDVLKVGDIPVLVRQIQFGTNGTTVTSLVVGFI